jgi:hypothetical protein
LATIVIPYRPREAFRPFHNSDKRWKVLVFHRRAGKTVAAINHLIKGAVICKRERPIFRYVSPFLSQAKAIAWEYLKHYAAPITVKTNESELWVEVLGGGRVRLFGADNADAMRGMYSDGDFYDEFGDFRPSILGNVLRPALSDRQGWGVFGGTPKGKNQFWEIKETARRNPDEWFLMEMPASKSGLLDQSELLDARKHLSESQYEQEYECSFEAELIGSYWGRELRQLEQAGRITEVMFDDSVPVFTAWDLGFGDDTAIWWYQVIRGEIHVLDFFCASGADLSVYASQILARKVRIDIEGDKVVAHVGEVIEDLAHRVRYKYQTHWLPHDARAKTLAAKGKSIIEQLAAPLGLDKLAIVPNLGLEDGIQSVRLMLPRVWFDKKCEEGLEALRQYQREYDEDKKAFRDKPRHDWTSHPADAFRMMAVAWQHEVKELSVDQPMRGLMVGVPSVSLDELWKTAQPKRRRI